MPLGAMVLMKPMFNISFFSSLGSIFEKVECSKMDSFPVASPDLSNPFLPCPAKIYTNNAASIVFANGLIALIYLRIGGSKIIPSIVQPIMIYMIDIFWDVSGHIKESKSMRQVMGLIDGDVSISLIGAACDISGNGRVTQRDLPSKNTSIRVVIQQLFEALLGYNFFSHWLSPKKSVSGGEVLAAPRVPIISQGAV